MSRAEDENVIQAAAPKRSDQALGPLEARGSSSPTSRLPVSTPTQRTASWRCFAGSRARKALRSSAACTSRTSPALTPIVLLAFAVV